METREAALFQALDRFAAGDHTDALEALADIAGNYPDFRAARLIKESLHETGNLRASLADLIPPAVFTLLEDPTDEAHSRLTYWFERPPRGYLPDVLIEPAPDRRKVVVADTAHSRLYLFEWSDGTWTMRGDWYASTGRGGSSKQREGDMKTPLGVYFVTMWVAGRFLSDLYGVGALGLNYPNDWDRRRQRGGFGIWIHGEPHGIKSRPPRWSQGCLIVSNHADRPRQDFDLRSVRPSRFRAHVPTWRESPRCGRGIAAAALAGTAAGGDDDRRRTEPSPVRETRVSCASRAVSAPSS